MRYALPLIALLALGCGTMPDPNDPKEVTMDAEVLRRNLKATSDMLNERVAKGEISEEQRAKLIEDRATQLLDAVEPETIEVDKAWQYGDIFRTAKRWEQAAALYRVAVKNAKTDDRRVNDSLRLAEALAHLNKVDEAISTAKSVFEVPDHEKAPILPAVLFEIVPAARAKDRDEELAKLLEEAIAQHRQVIVDPKTEPGAAFLAARPHLVRRAWNLVIDLYSQSGDMAAAEEAAKKAQRDALSGAAV